MHLINKPDTDYTGQETFVWEQYQKRCWDFFPVGECFRTVIWKFTNLQIN